MGKWLALAAFASIAVLPTASLAQGLPENRIEFRGSYNCSQGPTNMTLRASGRNPGALSGELDFRVLSSGVSGSYNVSVEVGPDGAITIVPTGWINQPRGFGLAAMAGTISPDGLVISGQVQSTGCTTFEARAVGQPVTRPSVVEARPAMPSSERPDDASFAGTIEYRGSAEYRITRRPDLTSGRITLGEVLGAPTQSGRGGVNISLEIDGSNVTGQLHYDLSGFTQTFSVRGTRQDGVCQLMDQQRGTRFEGPCTSAGFSGKATAQFDSRSTLNIDFQSMTRLALSRAERQRQVEAQRLAEQQRAEAARQARIREASDAIWLALGGAPNPNRIWQPVQSSPQRWGLTADDLVAMPSAEILVKARVARRLPEIREASARGDADALFLMGLASAAGAGIASNQSAAIESFRSAARLGHVRALGDLAQRLQASAASDGVTRLRDTAVSHGHLPAAVDAARAVENSDGSANPAAGQLHCAIAETARARTYRFAYLGRSFNYCAIASETFGGRSGQFQQENIVSNYQMAASLGSDTAYGNLALIYREGNVVRQDFAEARRYATIGAASSCQECRSHALVELALLALSGLGEPRNRDKGLQLLRDAVQADPRNTSAVRLLANPDGNMQTNTWPNESVRRAMDRERQEEEDRFERQIRRN